MTFNVSHNMTKIFTVLGVKKINVALGQKRLSGPGLRCAVLALSAVCVSGMSVCQGLEAVFSNDSSDR